jgi:hypothetical protein
MDHSDPSEIGTNLGLNTIISSDNSADTDPLKKVNKKIVAFDLIGAVKLCPRQIEFGAC